MIDALTLDQIQTFLAVVRAGSFSAAAREQNRATSAITYAVDKLEEQLGILLFDRSNYRPELTEVGRILLPRARRVIEEVDDLRVIARGISGGLEAEISIVVDVMFPMELLSAPLQRFQEAFPGVQLRIIVESLANSTRLIADGQCMMGLVVGFATSGLDLISVPVVETTLVVVASPTHPLARIKGSVGTEALSHHVQLVLTDRTNAAGSQDYGVYSSQTWRLSDLSAKHEMLRAGLGFGSLPVHLAREDLETGRLVPLKLATKLGDSVRFPFVLAWRKDQPIGPATQVLVAQLSSHRATTSTDEVRVRNPPKLVHSRRTRSNRRKKP